LLPPVHGTFLDFEHVVAHHPEQTDASGAGAGDKGGGPMLTRHVRRFLLISAAGLALAILGSGAAQAASATLVLSDRANFAGVGRLGPAKGTFVFASNKCTLMSDQETQPFPCQLTGQLMRGAPITGFATLKSADGTVNWKFTLTPTGNGLYKMTGRGTEMDAPDPTGQPAPPYPCVVIGVIKIAPTPAGFAFSGSLAVGEASTAP
jgi:hypothetical protein